MKSFEEQFPGLSKETKPCEESDEFYSKGEMIACYDEDIQKHCLDKQIVAKLLFKIYTLSIREGQKEIKELVTKFQAEHEISFEGLE